MRKSSNKWEAFNGDSETAWALRGFETFVKDLYANPGFVNKLLDRILEWKTELGRRFIELGVDMVAISDDLGMQTELMLSPERRERMSLEAS